MSVNYFVINKCHEKIYILTNNIFNLPQRFTLENETEQFSLSDIMVEPAKIDLISFVITLGFIGILVSNPYGGIVGALIGILVGMYYFKITDKEIKIAKERLIQRIKNGQQTE